MRNSAGYRQRRRRTDMRRKRRRSSRGGTGAGRYIFNGILWTTSMIMILTLLPAESAASRKLEEITAEGSALAAAADKIFESGKVFGDENEQVPEENISEKEETEGKDGAGTAAEVSGNKEAETDTDTGTGTGSQAANRSIVLTDHVTYISDPADSEAQPDTEAAEKTGTAPSAVAERVSAIAKETAQGSSDEGETAISKGTGNIVIYHTHATESYLPASASNAHTTELSSTVREAGQTLKAQLEQHGYSVVHDMTLHDYPSYNKSYNRSLETVKKLCAAYSNRKLIVDLHRDAAVSGKANTTVIDGKTVASFCLVVGTENANYSALRALADRITAEANKMYPGFAKPVVEKPHKYNEYVSDSYILLEMGNNANTIEEVNSAMPYLANVLTEVLG